MLGMLNQNIKSRAVRRANVIAGQVKALSGAISREEYCIELLTQSRAIQRSLKSLDALLLQNHLISHVKHQLTDTREEGRAVKELLAVFDLSSR
jgi:CsoR family transcriptional regulator, copper-sensing transcriptional repressor